MKRPKRPGEGRPSSYDPKYCQSIIKYFDIPHSYDKAIAKVTGKNDYSREETKEVANPIRFFSGFARSIGFSVQALHDWKAKYPEFLEAFTRAKELQQEMLVSNSLKGLYDSRYSVFATKNMTDWRDKVEMAHGVTDETFEKYKNLSIEELQKKIQDILPGSRIAYIYK